MRWGLRSLYARIAAIFLVLLLALGAFQIWLALQTSYRSLIESEQRLNLNLARDLVDVFEPYLGEEVDTESIGRIFHDIMVMNPRVEMYLLDEEGRIISYFAPAEKIRRSAVDLDPIRRFLPGEGEPRLPILGDDPRSDRASKIFSAAPLGLGEDRSGYLYVILNSEQHDSALEWAWETTVASSGIVYIVVVVLLTAGIGLVLFRFVTRRLGQLTQTVKRFEEGDRSVRAEISSGDEIGRLGEAINTMAGTIVGNLETIEEKDRLRRELVANISHDLRGPLASMRGYLETILIKGGELDAERRERYLELVLGTVTRLSRLVEELFELSALEARAKRPREEQFSLAELVQDVLLKFQPQADERGVKLGSRLDHHLPLALGDIGLIERALSNLIENALKHTESGGAVDVEVNRSEERVEVVVRDTGRGIPPDEIPHIFERFYRASRERRAPGEGVGLGLAIAHRIVADHGSELTVESRLGEGTTFRFSLRRAGGPTPDADPPTAGTG